MFEQSPKYRDLIIVIQLLLMGGCVVCGGLFNRIRGGWNPWNMADEPESWPRDADLRLIMSAPFGLLTALLTQSFSLGLLSGVYTFYSYWIGWGIYMAIGRNPNNQLSRVGCFDWLVGRDCYGDDWNSLFARSFTGMSWRGLCQTLPVGWLLYRCGYSMDYAWSGFAMGLLYNMAWLTPTTNQDENFGQGTPLGEFFWGMWVTLAMIATTTGLRRRVEWGTVVTDAESEAANLLDLEVDDHGPRRLSDEDEDDNRGAKACNSYCIFPGYLTTHSFKLLMMNFIMAALISMYQMVLLVSCIEYGQVQQSDMTNQNQTEQGLIVCTVALPVVEFGFWLYELNVCGIKRISDQVSVFVRTPAMASGSCTHILSVMAQCCCCYRSKKRTPLSEYQRTHGYRASSTVRADHDTLATITSSTRASLPMSTDTETFRTFTGAKSRTDRGMVNPLLDTPVDGSIGPEPVFCGLGFEGRSRWPIFPFLVFVRIVTVCLVLFLIPFTIYTAIIKRNEHDNPCGPLPPP